MNIQIRKQSSPYNGYRYSMRTMYGQQNEELLIEGKVFAQRNIDHKDASNSQKWEVVDEYSKVLNAIDSLIGRLYQKQETDYLNYDDIYNKLSEFCTDHDTCANFAQEIKEYADVSRKKAEILKKDDIYEKNVADFSFDLSIFLNENKTQYIVDNGPFFRYNTGDVTQFSGAAVACIFTFQTDRKGNVYVPCIEARRHHHGF